MRTWSMELVVIIQTYMREFLSIIPIFKGGMGKYPFLILSKIMS